MIIHFVKIVQGVIKMYRLYVEVGEFKTKKEAIEYAELTTDETIKTLIKEDN